MDPKSYEFALGPDYLQMKKISGAQGFFDDGLTYLFTKSDGELWPIRPRHIHFEVNTDTAKEVETCDFRFYTVEKVEAQQDESRRMLEDEEEVTKETV